MHGFRLVLASLLPLCVGRAERERRLLARGSGAPGGSRWQVSCDARNAHETTPGRWHARAASYLLHECRCDDVFCSNRAQTGVAELCGPTWDKVAQYVGPVRTAAECQVEWERRTESRWTSAGEWVGATPVRLSPHKTQQYSAFGSRCPVIFTANLGDAGSARAERYRQYAGSTDSSIRTRASAGGCGVHARGWRTATVQSQNAIPTTRRSLALRYMWG